VVVVVKYRHPAWAAAVVVVVARPPLTVAKVAAVPRAG